jgi:hypothetical protein
LNEVVVVVWRGIGCGVKVALQALQTGHETVLKKRTRESEGTELGILNPR